MSIDDRAITIATIRQKIAHLHFMANDSEKEAAKPMSQGSKGYYEGRGVAFRYSADTLVSILELMGEKP